jgi:pimeloyl-ACP methyl ester carboxylesterase
MPYLPLSHAGRIHYAERGERREGAPPAVFIHGAGASSAIWNMVLARVARSGRALAVDLPGHGASALEGTTLDGTGSGTLTLSRYRDALGELAGTLCLGPSVLVGHSMGALVAIAAALAWPDKVRALVLCGAAPRVAIHAELIDLLRRQPAGALPWLADHALSPRAHPAVRRGFLAAGMVAPVEVVLADYAIVADTDLGDRMPAIACPIIWVDGADDRIVPPDPARRGELVTVPNAGHLLPIEAPGAIADAVRGLLA